MPENAGRKTIDFPAKGILDTRSLPDEVRFDHYRWVEACELTEKQRLCRATGYQRLLSGDPYNNEDLHDRLGYARQQISSGFQAETVAGFSKLFVATQNQVFAKSNSTGNWQRIWDTLGGDPESGVSEKKLMYAQVGDIVVMTNNFDKPVYHVIDQPPETNGQFVSLINDLESLNITKVGVVVEWGGVVFYMNLVEDGVKQSNRIVWSDLRRPLALIPKTGSLAGAVTLNPGEVILNAKPLDNVLLVYTNKRIVIGTPGSVEQPFIFDKRYTPAQGSNNEDLLAFKFTLVSTGAEHLYFGKDGIYKFSLFDPAPVRVEWLHQSTSIIFDDINLERCNVHVAGYETKKKRIWWSWARANESTPSMTIRVTVDATRPFVDLRMKGYPCFFNYEPDALMSLRRFLLDQCICTLAELDTYGLNASDQHEGGLCYAESDVACETRPANFYSGTNQEIIIDAEETIEVEDYTGSPDADSLFSRLGGATIEDLCAAEYSSNECNAASIFCFSAADDMCLKQATAVYYEEKCIGFEGCGVYERLGYRSLIRSGALHFQKKHDNKVLHYFGIDYVAGVAVEPSQLILSIDVSSQPVDPNTASGRCVILWEEQDPQKLECQSDADAAQHIRDNTRPDLPIEYGLLQTGNFLYYELEIVNTEVDPEDTGGEVCFSSWAMTVEYKPRRG